ncbi:hypothetical protein RND81_11G183000 [Saponaria officinalis]|uniref:Uncharacterized protein n=1 Tax=Saponaria officinalis TaxID=3572 RepID=A0AAW1HMS7_SAPOF
MLFTSHEDLLVGINFSRLIAKPDPSTEFPSQLSTSAPFLESVQSFSSLRTKADANVDLNDILAAAKAATESAERAATAASLVRLRISEILKGKNGESVTGQVFLSGLRKTHLMLPILIAQLK